MGRTGKSTVAKCAQRLKPSPAAMRSAAHPLPAHLADVHEQRAHDHDKEEQHGGVPGEKAVYALQGAAQEAGTGQAATERAQAGRRRPLRGWGSRASWPLILSTTIFTRHTGGEQAWGLAAAEIMAG